jgi:hypothetical protein
MFYIPEALVEHMHFAFKKAEYDSTYQAHRVGKTAERYKDECTFHDTAEERENDANKLKELMK